MSTNASPIRRNSLRYPGYDYRQAGAIFVTICTHHRQRLFGSVDNGVVSPSLPGFAAERYWLGIPERFPGVLVDAYVVMPDHLHGIVMKGTDPALELEASVSDVVRWFKVCMRSAYRKNVANGTWMPYQSELWQRRFNDRIIRNEREFEQIQDYILSNPARWQSRVDPTWDGVGGLAPTNGFLGADLRSSRPPDSPFAADSAS